MKIIKTAIGTITSMITDAGSIKTPMLKVDAPVSIQAMLLARTSGPI